MINRVVLVGRITKDPLIRRAQSGTSVASFTIAINRIARQGQEQQSDFINCVAFSKTAEYMEQYIKKGYLLGVEGRIQTRNYENSAQQKVYVTEVVCDSVQNYEPRNSARQQGNYGMDSNYMPEPPQYNPNVRDDEISPTLDISSDDLPF